MLSGFTQEMLRTLLCLEKLFHLCEGYILLFAFHEPFKRTLIQQNDALELQLTNTQTQTQSSPTYGINFARFHLAASAMMEFYLANRVDHNNLGN